MTHVIFVCEIDTDLSIESKVGNNILLQLQLSDNASVLLLSKYKVDIDSVVFTLSLCFLPLTRLSRLDFPIFPTSKSFIQSLQFALNDCPGTFEIHDFYFSICNHLSWKDAFNSLHIFILLSKTNRIQWKLRSCLQEISFRTEMKFTLGHSFKHLKWISFPILRTEMKLISVVWTHGIVIFKLFHCKIKLILGEMKVHVKHLSEKLSCQKKSCFVNILLNSYTFSRN